jgi:hypothetical protein
MKDEHVLVVLVIFTTLQVFNLLPESVSDVLWFFQAIAR